MFISLHTPILIILLNSNLIASCRFSLASLSEFPQACWWPCYKRLSVSRQRKKEEEDQYQPSTFAMICMDEENDNAKTAEETQSEEKEEQSEEDEQNNVQDDAQVPMTFEEMLLRCEEQIDSSHQ